MDIDDFQLKVEESFFFGKEEWESISVQEKKVQITKK